MPGPHARGAGAPPRAAAAEPGASAPRRELDVTSPAARRFARDLILEYLDLFPGRYWHAGADEYLLPADYALYPQLERYARARYGPPGERGATPTSTSSTGWTGWCARADGRCACGTTGWPTAARCRLRRDVVVDWWAGHTGPGPRALARPRPPHPERRLVAHLLRGRARSAGPALDASAYEHGRSTASAAWRSASSRRRNPAVVLPRGRGVSWARSCTCGTTTPTARRCQTARGIAPRLRVLAQKTWDSPTPCAVRRYAPSSAWQ